MRTPWVYQAGSDTTVGFDVIEARTFEARFVLDERWHRAEPEPNEGTDANDAVLFVGGGTAASASLSCGDCTWTYLDNSGEWNEPDRPSITLEELVREVHAHALECVGRRVRDELGQGKEGGVTPNEAGAGEGRKEGRKDRQEGLGT